MESTRIAVRRVAGRAEAGVSGVDLREDPGDATVAESPRVVLTHRVLFFRGRGTATPGTWPSAAAPAPSPGTRAARGPSSSRVVTGSARTWSGAVIRGSRDGRTRVCLPGRTRLPPGG
ncbi:hypothetical protein [Streptomyces somaliensis]|uniref:hypothetical protein n=1 Tax=Streptomyces somaliensis TaxID=78355 RepID=UPI0034E97F7F|nr:hypothetical protein [Streptomyces somaliensis]